MRRFYIRLLYRLGLRKPPDPPRVWRDAEARRRWTAPTEPGTKDQETIGVEEQIFEPGDLVMFTDTMEVVRVRGLAELAGFNGPRPAILVERGVGGEAKDFLGESLIIIGAAQRD